MVFVLNYIIRKGLDTCISAWSNGKNYYGTSFCRCALLATTCVALLIKSHFHFLENLWCVAYHQLYRSDSLL